MIEGDSPILQRWRGLTPRERALVSILLGLAALLAAFYLGVRPGLDAMASAQDRNERAAADLAEVRRLSSDLASLNARIAATPLETAARAAEASAIESGLRVVAIQEEIDSLRIVVSGPNSAALLAWAADVSEAIVMGAARISIQPAPGGIEADILFSREAV